METRLFILKGYKETGVISKEDTGMIREAAEILKRGGLVAFPTETVYGLGANAFNVSSALKIYEAKGRPSDNPLIVHICDISSLKKIASEIPADTQKLMDRFWPGPMTLIFKKTGDIPGEITGGLDTVAVRFPSHPVANMLIREAGFAIAAPSANLSGHPSTTSAKHCIDDLWGRVDAIIDGGDSRIGLESSIIDVTDRGVLLLRPGAITREMIEETLSETLRMDPALKGPVSKGIRPRAPGMKYRHYAPKARMVLVCAKDEGDKGVWTSGDIADRVARGILDIIDREKSVYTHIALMCSIECCCSMGISDKDVKKGNTVLCGAKIALKCPGSRRDPEGIAHSMFELLRDCDRQGVDFVIAEGYDESGLFLAVMNRLKKAAAWQMVTV